MVKAIDVQDYFFSKAVNEDGEIPLHIRHHILSAVDYLYGLKFVEDRIERSFHEEMALAARNKNLKFDPKKIDSKSSRITALRIGLLRILIFKKPVSPHMKTKTMG